MAAAVNDSATDTDEAIDDEDDDIDDGIDVVRIMFSDAFLAALRCGTTSKSLAG